MAEHEPVASRRIRLTYADTDAAAILYYAAWFPWMERVSVEWAFERGLRYDRMLAEHGAAPVARATSCEYLAKTRVYDEIDLDMRVEHVGTTSYRLGFTMTRVPDRVVVARSALTLVCLDRDGHATPVPAGLRSVLQEARDE
jgi:YbgC/YbaW family acyl-CoA thioester hydrolase